MPFLGSEERKLRREHDADLMEPCYMRRELGISHALADEFEPEVWDYENEDSDAGASVR